LLLSPIAAFQISAFIVGIFAPTLVNSHVLVLIFFNPINRYLIVAANHVKPWEFYSVGFFRLILTDPLYYLLGHWYGDGALDWIEEKTGSSGMIPFVKKSFGKAGGLFVLIAPNTYVSVLAGASGMGVTTFFGLNIVGTIGRLILIDITGDFLEPVLDPVLDFVKRYQWPLVVVSLLIFGLQMVMNRKKGKGSPLESAGQLADELEASIEKEEAEAQAEEAPPAKKAPAKKVAAKKAANARKTTKAT
jgi:membrane protein DedA with SNARE-associated domain